MSDGRMEAGGELDAPDAFTESVPWLRASGQLQGTRNDSYRGE